MDIQTIVDLVITVATVTIPPAAFTAAVIPPKYLGPLNSIIQFLALNFGHAKNTEAS